MSEDWKALVFSDGDVRFTVTKEQLETMVAALDSGDAEMAFPVLDKTIAEIVATAREEQED